MTTVETRKAWNRLTNSTLWIDYFKVKDILRRK